MNKTNNTINNVSLSNFIDSFLPGYFGFIATFEFLFGQLHTNLQFNFKLTHKIFKAINSKYYNFSLIIEFKSESQGEKKKV